MSSTVAQILDRLDAILHANALTGTKVFRDRADAESREETPCFNVLAREDVIEPFSVEMDRHELAVELKVAVRDPVPTMAAEAQHAAVHGPIATDATLKTLCVSVRQLAAAYDRAEADATSLIKTVHYRFIYMIDQSTL